MSIRLVIPFLTLLALGACGDPSPTAETPATIYVAKTIITMNPAQPRATALALAGDRILAVGDLDAVRAALGTRTHTLDQRFADKVVMPGFIDPHVHPFIGAILMPMEFLAPEDWNFLEKQSKGCRTPEAYRARLKTLEAERTDPEEWLWVWGYHGSFHGDVNRKHLDEISRTRPIIQWHRSFHEIHMNTAALRAVGITEEDVAGVAQTDWETGHFYENGLAIAAPAVIPILMEPARWKGGLRMLLRNMTARGITTTADLAAGSLGAKEIELLKEVFDAPDVALRTFMIPLAKTSYEKHPDDPDAMMKDVRQWAGEGGTHVRFLENAKLLGDGAFFSQYMMLTDGYEDGHEGEWIMKPEAIQRAVDVLWDAGYQIHIHVNGDLGVKAALDALESCLARAPRDDHRFTLEHLGICFPQQMARAAKLGACVSGNPFYLHSMGEKYSEQGVGALRARHIFRAGSVVKNGMPLALHSDCLMAPADPLVLAWCAVNRRGLSGKELGPDEKISIQEALEAITIDAAFVLRQEQELGSIEAGKTADLTILEADPFEVDPMALKDIAVWGTVFEGRVVPAAR